MVYLLILEDYFIVGTIIITFCIQYFGNYKFALGNQYELNPESLPEYKNYILKTNAVIFPIQVMLIAKIYYGKVWCCGKKKRTRNSFIAYYRIGLTANSATILSCLMQILISYDVWYTV